MNKLLKCKQWIINAFEREKFPRKNRSVYDGDYCNAYDELNPERK